VRKVQRTGSAINVPAAEPNSCLLFIASGRHLTFM
jgi:hypothetical protein